MESNVFLLIFDLDMLIQFISIRSGFHRSMWDHSLSSTHATEDLRSRAVSLALHLRGRVNRSPVIKIPGSHDVIRCLDGWIIGSTFPDGFRFFSRYFKPFKHPFVNFRTLYSFGARCMIQANILSWRFNQRRYMMHAMLFMHFVFGTFLARPNALRMPCECLVTVRNLICQSFFYRL